MFVDSFNTLCGYNNESSNAPQNLYKTNKTEYYKNSVPIAKESESPSQVKGIYNAAQKFGLLGPTLKSAKIENFKNKRFNKIIEASEQNIKLPKTRRAGEHIRHEMIEKKQPYEPNLDTIIEEPSVFSKDSKSSTKDSDEIKTVSSEQRNKIFENLEHGELKKQLVEDAKKEIKQDNQKKFSRKIRNKIFNDFNKEDELESTLSKNQKALDKGTYKDGNSWVSYVDTKNNNKGTLLEI
jgi:hypothetical protein